MPSEFMFRNGASHAAAPSAIRNRPCRAKPAFDLLRPKGRRAGQPALSPAASAPTTFNASAPVVARRVTMVPSLIPAPPGEINSKEHEYYPISRRNAHGEIQKQAFCKGFAGPVPACALQNPRYFACIVALSLLPLMRKIANPYRGRGWGLPGIRQLLTPFHIATLDTTINE